MATALKRLFRNWPRWVVWGLSAFIRSHAKADKTVKNGEGDCADGRRIDHFR
jgi:hypothetical protein